VVSFLVGENNIPAVWHPTQKAYFSSQGSTIQKIVNASASTYIPWVAGSSF